MTEEQRKKCHGIIHGHAVAAAAGNFVPIPVVGAFASCAVDIVTLFSMAKQLAKVFGGSIIDVGGDVASKTATKVAGKVVTNKAQQELSEIIVKKLAKDSLKTALKQLGVKSLGKFILPIAGSALSVAFLECAGWDLAKKLEKRLSSNSSTDNYLALPIGNHVRTMIVNLKT